MFEIGHRRTVPSVPKAQTALALPPRCHPLIRLIPTAMIQIPDSVEGALIISIVDFILSFFIISGIGVVLALLPLVNRYWKIDDKDLKGGH